MNQIVRIGRRALRPAKKILRGAKNSGVDQYYAPKAARLLKSLQAGTPPNVVFAGIPDRFWLWLNTRGYRKFPSLRDVLPSMPDEADQLRFTGGFGDATLTQAYAFYRVVKKFALESGLPWITGENQANEGADGDIVDFGCGWGRITRFFLKDIAPERLNDRARVRATHNPREVAAL
jgi:hypothetical protein